MLRFAHTILVLIVCAIFIGIMAGAASAAIKATPVAKPTVKHMIAGIDLSDRSRDIPRITPSPMPVMSLKPKPKVSHSTKYLASGRVKPTASARPTKISRKITNVGALTMRPSAAKASAKPKHLAARKVKPTASAKPTVKFLQVAPQGGQTPAQSYGIYGLGGYVPTPTTRPAVRVVPAGSPTPVPGSYTPRYPGEAGAGNTVVVPPAPTVTQTAAGVPASQVTIPYGRTGRGSVGTSSSVPLSDDQRYAGRGPGLVDSQAINRPAGAAPAWTPGVWPLHTATVQTPASAPGPNSRPTAFVCHCR